MGDKTDNVSWEEDEGGQTASRLAYWNILPRIQLLMA